MARCSKNTCSQCLDQENRMVGPGNGAGLLSLPGRPTNMGIVGQGPTAIAVSAGGSCLGIFLFCLSYLLCFRSIWEKAL